MVSSIFLSSEAWMISIMSSCYRILEPYGRWHANIMKIMHVFHFFFGKMTDAEGRCVRPMRCFLLNIMNSSISVCKIYDGIRGLSTSVFALKNYFRLCFQKLLSGKLHTFYFWEVSQSGNRTQDLGVWHLIASST